MNAYIARGRTVAKIAVPLERPNARGTRWVMRSTATRDPQTVKRMQAMVDRLGRFELRAWDLLAPVTSSPPTRTLMQLFESFERHRGDLVAMRADRDDVELAALVPAFLVHVRATTKAGSDTADHYAHYLQALAAAGIARRSQLTRAALSGWVDARTGAPATRRKYAAGVSAFCAWLVRQGVLERNPMREVPRPRKAAGRVQFLDEARMIALVDAQASPYRELSALIHGTGLDVSAGLAIEAGAIDLVAWGIPHVRPKTETPHTILIADWARPYVRELVRGMLPRAKVGAGVTRWALSKAHREACAALGITNYWLRDARHSWAVRWARMGGSAAQGAEQLGHRDGGVQFLSLYGRYVPDLAERELVEAKARHRHTG